MTNATHHLSAHTTVVSSSSYLLRTYAPHVPGLTTHYSPSRFRTHGTHYISLPCLWAGWGKIGYSRTEYFPPRQTKQTRWDCTTFLQTRISRPTTRGEHSQSIKGENPRTHHNYKNRYHHQSSAGERINVNTTNQSEPPHRKGTTPPHQQLETRTNTGIDTTTNA